MNKLSTFAILILSFLFLVITGVCIWVFSQYYKKISIESSELQEVALIIQDYSGLKKVLDKNKFWDRKFDGSTPTQLKIKAVVNKNYHGKFEMKKWGKLVVKVWISPEIMNLGSTRDIAITQQVLAGLNIKDEKQSKLFGLKLLWLKN